MDFTVDDPELADQVWRLIEDFNAVKAEARRIAALTHEERWKEYLCWHGIRGKELAGVGNLSWYGMTGSEKYQYGITIKGAIRIAKNLQFYPVDMAKYFESNEDLPCLMRGSIKAMRLKNKCVALEVCRRFLRKIKFTCIDPSEWQTLLDSKQGQNFRTRISNKWSPGGFFLRDLLKLVSNSFDCRNCLIDGEESLIGEQNLVIVEKLYSAHKKLEMQEKQYLNLNKKEKAQHKDWAKN